MVNPENVDFNEVRLVNFEVTFYCELCEDNRRMSGLLSQTIGPDKDENRSIFYTGDIVDEPLLANAITSLYPISIEPVEIKRGADNLALFCKVVHLNRYHTQKKH